MKMARLAAGARSAVVISFLPAGKWAVSVIGETVRQTTLAEPARVALEALMERGEIPFPDDAELAQVTFLPGPNEQILEHYRQYHPRARIGEKARRLIRDRLEDGWTVQDLCDAIDGCHRSRFHRGENTDGTAFQTLDLILRDSEHVQRFVETPERDPRPLTRQTAAERQIAEIVEWAREG
jgi:hypothetical protein